MTILEVMVWAVLSLIALTLAVAMLTQLLQAVRKETQRSHIYLAQVSSLAWIAEDAQYANGAGVVVYQDDAAPTYFSLHLSGGANDARQSEFDDRLVFYHWQPSNGNLIRRVARPPVLAFQPLLPQRPDLTQLQGLTANPAVETRKLADGVTLFKVDGKVAGLAQLTPPLRLRLEITSPDGKEKFLQEKTISPRMTL